MLRPSAIRPLASMAKAATRPAFKFQAPRITTTTPSIKSFHTTPRAWIKLGDPLPDTDALMEKTPGTRVNLAEEAQKVNNMLLIGVPAAFSPGCSTRHVPGYIDHPERERFEEIVVVAVNDVFV